MGQEVGEDERKALPGGQATNTSVLSSADGVGEPATVVVFAVGVTAVVQTNIGSPQLAAILLWLRR